MNLLRATLALLFATLAASAAHAQPTESPSRSSKPGKAPKQASTGTIDPKRDAKQAWSEMRKVPGELKKGVPAAGREAGKTFRGGWNKAKEGFTGKAPPTIPDPPK
jgi:hypothetical protein